MLVNVLELWFDFSCPYAYLASRRATAFAEGSGVELAWKPMLLGGVFRAIGAGNGPMATLSAPKAGHNHRDMHRWAEIFGVPLHVPTAHPMRTVRALRTLLALPERYWPAAIEQLFAVYWERNEDITDEAVIATALRRAGVLTGDITTALHRSNDDDIKAELRLRTDRAIELGIFGAPAWVVRRADHPPQLIWGQDRLAHVEATLAGWDSELAPPPGGPRPFGMRTSRFVGATTLDAFFDIASPFAYFALTQLPRLAEVCGVVPRLVPILLGALFRAIGQSDVPLLAMPAAKQDYTRVELARWAQWWGVPFSFPRKFPQRTVTAQRLCVLASERGSDIGVALASALARAMWVDQRDVEDEVTLRTILEAHGLPPNWIARTHDADIKAELARCTESAREVGVFGVPTFLVDGRILVWGQDRLDLVMRALGGWRPVYG